MNVPLLDLKGQFAKIKSHIMAEIEAVCENQAFILGAKVSETSIKDGVVTVSYEDKSGSQTVEFDKLIVAVGRRPYTEKLLSDDSGIRTDERGFIVVDDVCRTGVKGV